MLVETGKITCRKNKIWKRQKLTIFLELCYSEKSTE